MRTTVIGASLLVVGCFCPAYAQGVDSVIQQPASDVPPKCAAFSGGWSGDWPRNGRIFLWVVKVAPDCTAQVIYGKASKPSPSAKLSQATINGDTLTLPRPDGGTTIFDMKANAVMGRYRGPAGFNEAMMDRVSLEGATQLGAEEKALTEMVPLSHDVPPECGVFHGHWSGSWSQGNFGEQYLRVVEVKVIGGKCQARLSYSGSKSPMAAKTLADLNAGQLAFACNSSTAGTCGVPLGERRRVECDLHQFSRRLEQCHVQASAVVSRCRVRAA